MCAPFEAKQAVCVSVSLHLIPSWLWLCQYPTFKSIPVTSCADVRSIPVPSFSLSSFLLTQLWPLFFHSAIWIAFTCPGQSDISLSSSILSSASSWQGHTTASSGCLTGRQAGGWPWKLGEKVASLGLCCGPGECILVASVAVEMWALIAWTSQRKSCTWLGIRLRILLP